MQFKFSSLAATFAVSLALPAWAHHSHGNYDVTKWTQFEGTVKEVHLMNPHSWIYLEVKDDKGQPTLWALEATNPRGLLRIGINDIIRDRPLEELTADIADVAEALCAGPYALISERITGRFSREADE